MDIATNTAYQGMTAPTNGIVALGVCTVPSADGGSDKAGLTLGGTTTGNTVSQVRITVTGDTGHNQEGLRLMDSRKCGNWYR